MKEEWWTKMIFFSFFLDFVLLFLMDCHDDYVKDYEGKEGRR